MEQPESLLQVRYGGGRRLLADCEVVGSVGKGGSIVILLLIGFVIGTGFSWIIFWRRQRRQQRIEMEYRNRFGDAVKRQVPDVSAMVKAANTPTFSKGCELAPADSTLPKAASSLAEGPLAMGVAHSIKRDSLRQGLSVKEQRNPLAAADADSMLRSSSGNPFAGEIPSYNVRRNDACSLNNSPSHLGSGRPSVNNSPAGRQQAGLIGASVYTPATDPASPRITKPAPPASATASLGRAGPAAPAGDASSFAWPGMPESRPSATTAASEQQAAHARSESVLVHGTVDTAGAVAQAAPAAVERTEAAAAAAAAPSSGDYLAALHSTATNPFETPALRQDQEGAKAAHKQELLQQVRDDEYGDEDLDPEWASLLADLDTRLQAVGKPRLSGKERAVAIRSLIVATASQSADLALGKALHDVQSYRRAQASRAAAAQ